MVRPEIIVSLRNLSIDILKHDMPFKRKTISIANVEIHLIYFKEFLTEDYFHLLNEDELKRLFKFNHINRQREFIATRLLKREIFGDKHILYESHGAPYIEDEGFISISHSSNCSAIAVCPDFTIGLDLEKRSPKAAKLHHKFLNEEEMTFLNPGNELEMTEAWSCKEAMYKLAGRKKIIFKSDLVLKSKSVDSWEGEIINPTEKFFVKLLSIPEKEMIITINTHGIELISDK